MKTVTRKFIVFTLLLSGIISQQLNAQGWWYRKADYIQSARTSAVAFSIGTGGYIGTGFDSTSFRRNFAVYNQLSNAWTATASMGGSTGSGLSRDAAICFTVGTKAYVGLGQGSNPYLNDLWEYDAGSDTWTQKANFGGTARRAATSFSLNNKGYVVCGQDAGGLKKDMYMYDPTTNVWTAKSNFPGTARRLPVAFTIGTAAFVGTGDDGAFTKDFYRYNPTSDTWIPIPDFGGTARYAATCFVIGTDGYVGTGYDNTLSNRKDFWKYNSLTNSWSAVKDFSGTARSNAVGFAIGAFGYVGTGYDTLTAKDLWAYDPNSNGIEETQLFRASLKVYPNPMTESATLRFDKEAFNAFGKISFSLFDLQGREVMKQTEIANEETTLLRNDLPSGYYVYRFIGDQTVLATGKIIIE